MLCLHSGGDPIFIKRRHIDTSFSVIEDKYCQEKWVSADIYCVTREKASEECKTESEKSVFSLIHEPELMSDTSMLGKGQSKVSL